MLAEAEATSLDEHFATIIIRDDEMKEYLKQHHDFRLLDQVFTDFLSSNKHRRTTWTFVRAAALCQKPFSRQGICL